MTKVRIILTFVVQENFRFDLVRSAGGGSMIRSRLTTKAQTTIPQPVREALRLKIGDEIAYRIDGDKVILTRGRSGDVDDPFATFSEWDSEADRTGYASL
ncbi:hypothetical protein BH23GEM9_BH23GEM9_26700 [soil metagenome]